MSLSGLPFSVPAQYVPLIEISAARWGVPDTLLASQLNSESGFNANAKSSAGAEGIAQFEPGTAASIGVNPWIPSSAIDGMAQLDAQYNAQFGSWDLALAAYNAGPGAVQQAGNQVPNIPETQKYVSSVLANAGLASDTGSGSSSASGASNSGFGGIVSLLANIDSGTFWTRIGKGAIAAGIIGGGLFFLVKKEPGTMKPMKELVNIP